MGRRCDERCSGVRSGTNESRKSPLKWEWVSGCICIQQQARLWFRGARGLEEPRAGQPICTQRQAFFYIEELLISADLYASIAALASTNPLSKAHILKKWREVLNPVILRCCHACSAPFCHPAEDRPVKIAAVIDLFSLLSHTTRSIS